MRLLRNASPTEDFGTVARPELGAAGFDARARVLERRDHPNLGDAGPRRWCGPCRGRTVSAWRGLGSFAQLATKSDGNFRPLTVQPANLIAQAIDVLGSRQTPWFDAQPWREPPYNDAATLNDASKPQCKGRT